MLYIILMCITHFMFFANDLSLAASVQFNSVTQSCPILCDPMDSSMPGFPLSPAPEAYSNS